MMPRPPAIPLRSSSLHLRQDCPDQQQQRQQAHHHQPRADSAQATAPTSPTSIFHTRSSGPTSYNTTLPLSPNSPLFNTNAPSITLSAPDDASSKRLSIHSIHAHSGPAISGSLETARTAPDGLRDKGVKWHDDLAREGNDPRDTANPWRDNVYGRRTYQLEGDDGRFLGIKRSERAERRKSAAIEIEEEIMRRVRGMASDG